MRGTELLEKMELIDPAFVEAADVEPKRKNRVWARWGAVAACICVIAAAAVTMPHLLPEKAAKPTPEPGGMTSQAEKPVPDADPGTAAAKKEKPETEQSGDPAEEQIVPAPRNGQFTAIHYNHASAALDAAKRYVSGYFTEELNCEELAAVTPNGLTPDIEVSGYAGYDGAGTLQDVVLNVDAHLTNETEVTVTFSESGILNCYEIAGEPALSRLNGYVFEIYEWSPDGTALHYDAFGEVNGCPTRISYTSGGLPEEQAKGDFGMIADFFTDYEEGKPDLSAIHADAIPEFLDLKLTLAEAQTDPDFGACLPGAAPAGFAEESVRRYKDQNYDYLSGLWTRSYDQLSWQVSYYQEQDANRLTGVDDVENYDLSLYPIPRADSVPDALRAIVNDPIFYAEELTLDAVYARTYKVEESGDSNGWRMNFSVKYGDFVVHVNAKGVEPEWLYQQLAALR